MVEKARRPQSVSYVSRADRENLAVGAVLRNWPHVFSILNLFGEYGMYPYEALIVAKSSSSRLDKPLSPPSSPSQMAKRGDEADEPIPQLVRLPYAGEAGGAR